MLDRYECSTRQKPCGTVAYAATSREHEALCSCSVPCFDETEAPARCSWLRQKSVIPENEGKNTLSKKTDAHITQDVMDELAWDPAVTVADLLVSIDQGRVTLTGAADTYSTTLEAEDAAYRVAGVTYVENDIVVDPAALGLRSDLDIAADIRTALALEYQVPDDRIAVSVLDGYVTLTGNVDWYYQRDAADEDTAMIQRVKGLTDEIDVDQPQASEADISAGIAKAFARNAELYDDDVDVAVDGSQVTLSGTVSIWSEYDMAEDTAWTAPGVSSVTNNIVVLFP